MKRQNKPTDFFDLLAQKGIISAANIKKTDTGGKRVSLGSIFREIIKELSTDPNLSPDPEGEPAFSAEEKYEREEYFSRRSAEEERKGEEAAAREQAAELRRAESQKQAAAQAAQKEERLHNANNLDNQTNRIRKKQSTARGSKQLLKNKRSLRQTFLLKEIISKPLGLK